MAPFPVQILRHTMESGGILKNGEMGSHKALFILYVMMPPLPLGHVGVERQTTVLTPESFDLSCAVV